MSSKEHKRIFLISNMYPSKLDVRYGIFVKHFEEAVHNKFKVERIVVTKKNYSILKLINYFLVYLKVLSLIFRCKRTDIIYVHFPLYFAPVVIMLQWTPALIVLNFHGSDATFESLLKKGFKWFLERLVRRADKIVVPSDYYMGEIAKIFHIAQSDRIYVYPSGGINSGLFRAIPKKEEEVFVLGFVSNFIETKGWRIFLEALSKISIENTGLKVKGIMVGDGPDRPQIIELVDKLGVNIELVGNVPQNQLADFYSMFDIFIFPTYRKEESLGLVGLEAMMCGVPVIASKVGGPLGYVSEGYNGFLFEKQDVNELILKIEQFQKLTKKEVAEMKRNCMFTAKKYDSSSVNQELIKMLESLNHRK